MTLKRYSQSGVVAVLESWIARVESHGLYANFRDESVDLIAVDAGMVDAAKSLLADVKLLNTPACRLTKQRFKRLVELRWEVACTLPANSNLFTERTGYAQVRGKSKEKCFNYGKFNFDTNVVYSIFSEFF